MLPSVAYAPGYGGGRFRVYCHSVCFGFSFRVGGCVVRVAEGDIGKASTEAVVVRTRGRLDPPASG